MSLARGDPALLLQRNVFSPANAGMFPYSLVERMVPTPRLPEA